MNETQKRISAYQAALPHLRERVAAVALLLVMSVVMVTSVSFAWVTLSQAPEVASVSTTVTANGNLEIALASGNGTTPPAESKVGDSAATEGQSVVNANLTWGNLINLSDTSYGLENLVLRPAQLNTTALLSSPLYGAVYSDDGRIERLTSNFSYTSWVPPTDVAEGYFGLSNSLGVRAVSSTKVEAVGVMGTILKLQDIASGLNTSAGNTFTDITRNSEYMDLLAKLMGIHMTASLNSASEIAEYNVDISVTEEELNTLIAMYNAFITAHEQEAAAIAEVLNVQLYAAYGSDTSKYVEWTAASVLAIAETDSQFVTTADEDQGLAVGDYAYGVSLDGTTIKMIRIVDLADFIHDYNMLKEDVARIAEIVVLKSGNVQWNTKYTLSSGAQMSLADLVNRLVDVNTCLIKKSTESSYKTVKAVTDGGATAALDYMNSICDVVITNGVFKNFEQRSGGELNMQGLEISATAVVSRLNMAKSATISTNITTSATAPCDCVTDNEYVLTLYTGASDNVGEVMAQDTYALAVDFWVRTNASGSYLVLEGNIITDPEEVVATGKDANGAPVNLYTITRTDTMDAEDGTTTTVMQSYTLYETEVVAEAPVSRWYTTDGKAFELLDGEAPVESGTTTDKAGNTVTAYTLSRNWTTSTETSTQLYKVESDGAVTWYTTSHAVYQLQDGESEPTATGDVGTDGDGNQVELYTHSRVTSTTETVSYQLYQKTEGELSWINSEDSSVFTLQDGETPVQSGETYTLTRDGVTYTLWQGYVITEWYNAETYSVFLLNDGESEPVQMMETIYHVIGYDGENRVWNGEDKSYLTTDSTTQGSGSCYVYYADTPEDQARSMELLKAMNVAFIDANGALLATAKMDTDYAFEESGRVTVPLKLTGGVVLGEDETTGEVIYGITALERNEPTRITALVYLDGTKLGNENVLAASDIQGRLNIQFGSSQELVPVDNEDLENDELRVSATVDKTSFNYDTYEGEMKVRVTVAVDGDAPSNMTGFFLRQISSTQGSREEEMTFTNQDDGTWTADYVFDGPGVYLLRSVRLDGIDYDLGTVPQVTITGFSVASLTCAQAGAGNYINIMSAANSSTVNLKVKFVTEDINKMPKTVQGRFLRDDGTAVNVDFTYNATTGLWSGTARFISSGDYTLKHLVLDGKHTELDESMWHTATVTLGMRVAVYTTSPRSFKYLPSEMADNEKVLAMQVKIMDNTGEEKEGLQGAWLYYSMQGSVQTMATELKWDAASGYYVGELLSLESGGAGTWRFQSVTVSGNTLSTATTAPTFQMISPEPPSFVSANEGKTSYLFAPNGDAKLDAKIKYSATATVVAVLEDGKGQEYTVEGTLNSTTDNVTQWFFTVPKDSSDMQDGYWTMREIRIWNYYTTEGDYIDSEENAMVIDIEEKTGEEYTVKVVQTVKLAFVEYTGTTEFSGAFLESHEFSGIQFTLTDFEGEGLNSVGSIALLYNYEGDSKKYGGYTSSAVSSYAFTVGFNTEDGITYTQSEAATMQYAGNYAPTEFTFIVGNQPYSYTSEESKRWPDNIPSFVVWSTAPTVKVTGVSPTSSVRYYTVTNPTSTDQLVTGNYNSKVGDYTAAVYIYVNNKSGWLDQEPATAILPKVNLSLSGVPSSGVSNATVSIGHQSNSAYAHSATFTNGTATLEVGGFEQGTASTLGVDKYPVIYPAGTQKIEQITLEYGSVTYTVDLSDVVTIYNPLLPATVSFAINDSTYTGTTPSAVVSSTGDVTTLTLPTIASWIENKQTDDASGEVITAGPTTTYQQTSEKRTTGCNSTTYYTPYTIVTTTWESSVTTTTWSVTHSITGWTVNGQTYAPGQTITVTGDATITAVVTETHNGDTAVETSTKTRTVVEVTAGSETTTNPGYTSVSSAPTGSDTGWVEK